MSVGAIILAAGASTRLQQSKQLLLFNNKPLLLHAIETAREAGLQPVVVVLGENAEQHAALLNHQDVHAFENRAWKSGMGSSIKKGVQSIKTLQPDLTAFLLMVCDQPLLQPQHLRDMVALHQSNTSCIVASAYADSVGVPALFPTAYASELLMIGDEEGAKKVILKNIKSVSTVCFPGGVIDIDTVEDYQELLRRTPGDHL
jgi:molybdenum cofactor cytidylyltransferase